MGKVKKRQYVFLSNWIGQDKETESVMGRFLIKCIELERLNK